ncbi:ABC transporter permease [bacterium]|nr:ABC transporter permease [bacterium]
MLKNYLKIAFRNLVKRRFFSSLNILGLSIGMAACLLIFQYVAFEYSFDRFNVNKDHLYRVNMITKQNEVARDNEIYTYYGMGPAIAEQVPEIEGYTRVHPNWSAGTFVFRDAEGQQQAIKAKGIYFVDPAFLSLFTYPLTQGDPTSALKQPRTMLISESMVRRFFGDQDPVGRQLEVIAWTEGEYRITGVFKDVPKNSHFQFDFLLPIRDILEDDHGQYYGQGWSWTNFYTYVQLKPDADLTAVASKFEQIVMENKQEQFNRGNISAEIQLQPLPDIHLYSPTSATDVVQGNYKTVYFFTIVALFILIIAWVNYINLSTARAVERAKEVGVRKAAGARRQQLVWQFLLEAVLMNGVALLLAIGLAWWLLPYLNQLAGVAIPNDIWLNPRFWGAFLAIFGVGAGLSTLYPAYILSSFEPTTVLKGQLHALTSRISLRKVLVVFQFAASMALLTGTYIVYSQVDYMRRLDLGIDLEQVLIVRRPPILQEGANFSEMKQTFEDELRKFPAIVKVAASTAIPGDGYTLGTSFRKESAQHSESAMCKVEWIDYDFLDTYGISVLAGRNFGPTFTADTSAVLINETAALTLGFDTPTDAVGQSINIGGGRNLHQVVGLTKDFNWMSVAQPTDPLLFLLTRTGRNFSIRLKSENLTETIANIREVYDKAFPGNPFDFFFLDAYFDQQYRADQRFGTLFGAFALLAILVACLGLIGLAAYTASQRTKEIGVRKVLGASLVAIVRLLISDFAKLVLLALALTIPLAYLGAEYWLTNFASRIDLSFWLFLIPGAVVFAFALFAVSYHTVRISMTDPVKSLRYE